MLSNLFALIWIEMFNQSQHRIIKNILPDTYLQGIHFPAIELTVFKTFRSLRSNGQLPDPAPTWLHIPAMLKIASIKGIFKMSHQNKIITRKHLRLYYYQNEYWKISRKTKNKSTQNWDCLLKLNVPWPAQK